MTQPLNVLFREIHKNAWLKKLPPAERRNGAFPKRGERVWVVFCVHDDSEAFLEVYPDQKLAVTHKPDWFVSLNSCLHISPTICALEDDYEFVITLNSDMIRLSAPSWEIMMEWVETIRSKLQEMRILSPRENVYSKMPEVRLPLAPTRDPNSPLPPPPVGPSSLVPGIEPVRFEDSDSNGAGTPEISATVSHSSSEGASTPRNVQNSINLDVRTSTALYITQSEPVVYTRPTRHVLNRAASVPESQSSFSSTLITPPHARNNSSNVTVIEVSTSSAAPRSELPTASTGVFNFNLLQNSVNSLQNMHLLDIEPALLEEQEEASRRQTSLPIVHNHQSSATVRRENSLREENSRVSNSPGPSRTLSGSLQDLSDISGHYECVFLPAQSPNMRQEVSSGSPVCIASRSRSSESNPSVAATTRVPAPAASSARSAEQNLPAPLQELVLGESAGAAAQQRRRSRSTSLSEGTSPQASRTPEERNDRNGRSRGGGSGGGGMAGRSEGERRLQPAPHPYRQPGVGIAMDRLTLREQQVLQLRREMMHPGGVRLQLRRKDCTNSIALVDAFGAVWVAGWKQKEHPMLYNALHIGDQLLSVGGAVVQSANDAQKLVRGASSLYVEFVIRRVPCGRVFAIRRDSEGQNLGIVQESNTAEIRDVLPGSPAARHGLVPRAQTCDGLSLTNWVLTEINGRPLNLFFKDGEVRDRLNAVGRDISILVQPSDLVKQLKKQLKAIRGYKDYIVQ